MCRSVYSSKQAPVCIVDGDDRFTSRAPMRYKATWKSSDGSARETALWCLKNRFIRCRAQHEQTSAELWSSRLHDSVEQARRVGPVPPKPTLFAKLFVCREFKSEMGELQELLAVNLEECMKSLKRLAAGGMLIFVATSPVQRISADRKRHRETRGHLCDRKPANCWTIKASSSRTNKIAAAGPRISVQDPFRRSNDDSANQTVLPG